MKLRAGGAFARRGFTLLEVVLALGLLLLGLSVVLGSLSFGAALAKTAELRMSAAEVVDAVVADLEESFFPLAPGGGVDAPEAVHERALAQRPGLSYSAVPTPIESGPWRDGLPVEYSVEIEIGWRAGGRQRARKFTVLLLREVPFGERMRRSFVEYDDAPALPPASQASPNGRVDTGSR